MALVIATATTVETLALIGGGEFSFGETREIDTALLARMPAGRRTVAFIPAASGSSDYAVHLGRYLSELEPSVNVVNVPIYRSRDARRQKNLDLLASAGMIYLGAGVTNNLLDALLGSPADLVMRDAAAGGTVIAAIGAAASCFGAWAANMRGGAAVRALEWLPNTVVDTGFEVADDVTLRRLMALPDVTVGLGIPPRTALVIGREGATEIVGSGSIAAFRKQ